MLKLLLRWTFVCGLLVILLPGVSLLAQFGDMNTDALLHDSRSDLYRTPGGATPFNTTVTLRLRATAGDLDSASVRVWDTRNQEQTLLPMQVVATTADGYDFWEATLDTGRKTTVLWYRFIVTKGARTVYYEDDTRVNNGPFIAAKEGGTGAAYGESPDLSFQITVYDPAFVTPEWMQNAVLYQIFPDRFRNGDTSNDPADGSETFYNELPLYFHETWNEPMLDGRVDFLPNGNGYWNSDFYGGDLAGITEKLDYLHELGVTGIYLNPIFLARSNHRYDTADFLQIDPMLGTLEDFQTLISEASARGIHIILDGVFNHMSSDSAIFDRYHRFDTDGACESLDSAYRSWFYFAAPRANQPAPCAGDPDPLYYVSWAGFDSIPRINNTIIETRKYVFLDENSVARTWGREGIGGWRLDVAPDIDNGSDPNNIYWEAFRTVVKNTNPDAVIIGEEWADSSEWLQGDEWDSTMNYRLRAGILGYVRDSDYQDNDSNGDRLISALAPSEFNSVIRAIEEDYPAQAYHALLNLLDSHDTSRLFFVVNNDPQLQQLAALAQFTLPGAPTIYYGDEIALDAPSRNDGGTLQDDPYNRAPYPWADTEGDAYPAPDEAMLAFYQQIAALRHANPALRTGEMVTLVTDDVTGVYAFLRLDTAAGNMALVVLNNGDAAQTVSLDFGGRVPSGLTLEPAFGGQTFDSGTANPQVRVGANSGNVWTVTAESSVFTANEAPTGVTVTGGNNRVTVSWQPVEGARGYLLYRSPVATGGYERATVGAIAATSYELEAPNGFRYYYAVAPVTDTRLIGPMSAGVAGTASAPISAAYYLGDAAAGSRTMGLVFGVTADLQAAVKVDGVTEAEGQATGVQAQAALVPVGDDLETANWEPMAYSGEQDGADVYSFAFAPQDVGAFQTVARFSTDAGLTWTVVTLPDGTLPLLTLESSDDTTPPAATGSVSILRASLSGVSLEWETVTDDNLFVYRVYRTNSAGDILLVAEVPAADGTTYKDTGVVEGETYIYAITAVDGALNESEQVLTDPVLIERQMVPVTFIVTVPDYTTPPPVYIAGDFAGNGYPTWDPAGIPMTQVDDTHWTVTLDLLEGSAIEYKYVRSDWVAVEKGDACDEIANRRVTATPDENGLMQVEDVIAKWRDLDGCG
ncbi:MAG: alpha amylase N-terminal ig-like domain-containing protein [Anaerolineaceae bacterium]|nr:alpha amylase N-terminal ig-like domain-containing protein [Anaerolineaceae bacterium]